MTDTADPRSELRLAHELPLSYAQPAWRAPGTLEPFRFRRVPVPEPQGEDDERLLNDIRETGIKEPLMVTADGRVFNGRARLRHARAQGLAQIPVRELVSPLTDLEIEMVAGGLALSKRYLNPLQLFQLLLACRELKEEQERAPTRRRGRPRKGGLTTVSAFLSKNHKGKRTDKLVGDLIGTSATHAFKLQAIHERSPDLYKRVLGGKLSVDAAYRQLPPAKAPKGGRRMPPEVPQMLEVEIPEKLFRLSTGFKNWPRADQDKWLALLGDLHEDLITAINEHEQPDPGAA